MNERRLSLLLTITLILLPGCVPSLPAGRLLPQDSLVRTLQDRLRTIRAAAPSEDLSFPADLDLAPLVGVGIETIQAAFGAPDYCWGESFSDPPCDERGRWIYHFYHLPEGSLGGGAEIALTLGSSRRVDSARWIFTQ